MTPATGLRAAALIAPALVLLTGCGHLAAAGASQPGSVATAVSPSPTTAASPAASASPSPSYDPTSTTPDASGLSGSQLNQIDTQINQIDNEINQAGQGLATSEGDPAQ
ncbi:MAG: hypothetical protein ABSA40_11205 [Candidatus Dormibacteria bacterium]|jgi:hypothetical protein